LLSSFGFAPTLAEKKIRPSKFSIQQRLISIYAFLVLSWFTMEPQHVKEKGCEESRNVLGRGLSSAVLLVP